MIEILNLSIYLAVVWPIFYEISLSQLFLKTDNQNIYCNWLIIYTSIKIKFHKGFIWEIVALLWSKKTYYE